MALATAQFNISGYPNGSDNTQRFQWHFGTVSFIGASPAYQQGGIRVNVSPLEAVKASPQNLTPQPQAYIVSNSGSGYEYTLNTQGALITNIALTTNVVTITAHNNLATGDVVLISGVTTATFLNGQKLTVLGGATATTFTANFTHANYVSAADTGFALPTSYATGLPFQGNLQIWQSGGAAAPQAELTTAALPAGIVGSATVNPDVIAFEVAFPRI